MRLISALGIVLALAGATPAAEFTEPGGEGRSIVAVGNGGQRPSFRIGRVDRAPEIDELLDGELPPDLVGQMTRASGFVQRTPEDGSPGSQRTVAWLGYDHRKLYVVFFAHDDETEGIRANMGRRESQFGDDIVEIQIDTYNDELRAYSFIVNPLGIQSDALFSEGRGNNFDFSWDAVWESNGRLTDWGYVVTMAIPFKALRFEGERPQEWGVLLVRDIQRTNENLFWPPVTTRIQGRLSQSAVMTGLDGVKPGTNFLITPYATGRSFEVLNESSATFEDESFDGEIGLDAKWVIEEKFSLDVTVNPDFSQVESDEPQITVNQRFEVFFPERRPFFLENRDFFEMPFNLLFTRRIAEPSGGARLTGKVGRTSIGLLAIDDEAPGKVEGIDAELRGESAAVGVVRVSQEFGDQSSVGVLVTRRDFEDDANTVASLDGRIKIDDNWSTTFQAAIARTVDGNDTVESEFSDQAYSLEFNRQGRHWGAHIHYREIGPQFNTDLGFVNRTDVRNFHMDQRYTFWPEGEALVSWTPSLFMANIEDETGLRIERRQAFNTNFNFRRQTDANFNVTNAEIVLRPVDFAGLDAPRAYSGDAIGIDANTRFASNFNVNARIGLFDAINFAPPDVEDPADPGQMLPGEPFSTDAIEGSVGFGVRPNRRSRLEGTWLWSRLESIEDGATILDNDILRLRFTYQFTPRLSLRAIVQEIDTQVDPERTSIPRNRTANGDLLLTYQVNPWTAAYLGYNANYDNFAIVDDGSGPTVILTADRLEQNAEQLFFKVSYLFGQ